MLGTKGESSAACQMLKCERKRGPRGQGGKEDWRGLGDPKLSQTKAPPTLPAPTPSQRNHMLQRGGGEGGCGEGAGMGGDLARPQRPFLAETSICSWREPRARPLLSKPAGGLQPCGEPCGHSVCSRLPGAHSPVHPVKSSLPQDVQELPVQSPRRRS